MKVVEIFNSIDGEGKRAGLPCTFIRLFGCNLNCSYCFGVKPGRNVPKLRRGYIHSTEKGSHKLPITQASKGDWIMTYDEDMNLVETQITSIEPRQVTEWYEVKIDDTLYFITAEHPIFTVNGLKRVDELQVGDIIIECKPNNYISYNASNCNSMFNPGAVSKRVRNTNYEEISRKISITRNKIFQEIKQNLDNNVPLTSWSKKCQQYYSSYCSTLTEEQRKKISERMKGSNNPNWKEEAIHSPNYNMLKTMIKLGDISHSQLSGKTLEEDNAKAFHVHHIDGNRENDNLDNLIVVTSREHNQIHERGYSFWKNDNRKDGKRLATLVANNGKQVKSIKHINVLEDDHYGKEYGPKDLTVYTISCSPYNTYLIDDMWVHNCDSRYACEKDENGEENCMVMSVSEIVDNVKAIGCPNITITGGEPLIHDGIHQLVRVLLEEGCWVNIESNGTKPVLPDFEEYAEDGQLFYTMDYKTNCSGMTDKMYPGSIVTLKHTDVLKFVVGSLDDLNQALQVVEKYDPKASIYVSPVFEKIEACEIVDFIKQHQLWDWKVQLQLHKYIYDPLERGV